jgi:hypothetical protein
MINSFKVRKWVAVLLPSLFATSGYVIGVMSYGMLGGIVAWASITLLLSIISILLLKNPFSAMLEGKGILALNLDSTGIIKPFIVNVDSPYIKGKLGKHEVSDVFDREAVFQLATPLKAKDNLEQLDDGTIVIRIPPTIYNKGRFSLFHYPVIIYNEQLKTVITKDFLSTGEKEAFAEHGILYLNRKMEELSSAIRDFGRHIIDTLKPKGAMGGKMTMIIIIIILVILGALFAPSIIDAIKGQGGTALTP